MRHLKWIVPALLLCAVVARADDAAKEKFAKELERTVSMRDASFYVANLDIDGMLDRAADGLDIPADSMREFTEGMKQGFDLGRQIVAGLGESGHYRLLRLHEVNGESRAMFRMVSDQGVNYHDLVLEERGGQVKIVDLYVALSGELMSQTLRRPLVGLAAAKNEAALDKLEGPEGEYIRHGNEIGRMSQLSRGGNPHEAMRVYNALPKSLQREKMLMIMRLLATRSIGDKEYMESIEAFNELFPNDPALYLIAIDYLVMKQRYDETVTTIEQLDEAVGGDPYLEAMKGDVRLQQGKPDEAIQHAQAAIDADPTLELPYWLMVAVSVETEDFESTARWLSRIEETLKLDISQAVASDYYAKFRESEAYKAWSAGRKR
jgi:hypothetical protein